MFVHLIFPLLHISNVLSESNHRSQPLRLALVILMLAHLISELVRKAHSVPRDLQRLGDRVSTESTDGDDAEAAHDGSRLGADGREFHAGELCGVAEERYAWNISRNLINKNNDKI